MSSSDLILNELRAARPVASPRLRERVRAIAAGQPERRPSLLGGLGVRRLLLVAAPTAAVLAVAVGVGVGLTRDAGRSIEGSAVGPVTQVGNGGAAGGAATGIQNDALRSTAPAPSQELQKAATLPPSQGRLQDYDASLRLQVDGVNGLSDATVKAMRVARSLGGYVGSVSYDAAANRRSAATIVLRVPTAKVETAILRLSGLGTILAQQVRIRDVQNVVNGFRDTTAALRNNIAALEQALAASGLTPERKAELELRLQDRRQALAGSLRATEAKVRAARLARISVALTTEAPKPTRESTRLDGIVDVLRWEGLGALYALVVLIPLALLAAAVLLPLRLRRRREETRLLDSN